MSKEELEKIDAQIKSYKSKLDKVQENYQALVNRLNLLMEKKMALDPHYVKIKCMKCGGLGYIKDGNGNKTICDICDGKEYNWAIRHE
mgnify:CR=1 FL=1